MDIQKKYGADALFTFPLIDAGAQDFVTSITPAAGDAKLWSDNQIFTNLTAEAVAFTSGSEEPTLGDTLVGASSSETCVFMFAVVSSGTWGGGDAAGVLFVKTVSGAFSGENLNIQGGTANVLTIGADFTAGLFGEVSNGLFACALTAAEMQCQQGIIHIIDSATKAWEDQAIKFVTFGNASALHPFDLDTATQDVDLASTGLDNIVLAEPSGVFSWGGSLKSVLSWMAAFFRNKQIQTTTSHALRNDADSADLGTASVNDSSDTLTKGEWS